jgi:predicted dithiol-disulfide oxidoreductase (DUF899 family)
MRFPNESDAYRDAREELLEDEKELRRRVEAVNQKRRALPLGGAVLMDYAFRDDAGEVRLSELFPEGKDSLVIYSMMYGPKMAEPCTSCTSIVDALNGQAHHINDRVPLVVVARSPIERLRQLADGRGWKTVRLLSSSENSYNGDYGAENEKGDQLPALNVFARRDGRIHHFYNTELLYAPSEPGMDGRHVDSIWPLWNVFDFTPEGRGAKWYPRLSY